MRLLHTAPDLAVWTDCLQEVQIEVVLTFSVFGRGALKCVDEVAPGFVLEEIFFRTRRNFPKIHI